MEIENKKEEKQLSKREFLFVIFIIFILSGLTFYHFKQWKESLKEVKPPKIEIPKVELFPKQEGYKEWISPDGRIKIKYQADWIEMRKEVFEGLTRENKGKTLFFAQKFIFDKAAQGFLTVQKLNLEEEITIKEIIENMKKDVESKKGEMEILNLELKDKSAILEAKYKKEGGPSLYSTEKIILAEKEFYLITFSTFEKNWKDFQKEAEEIINSVQFFK